MRGDFALEVEDEAYFESVDGIKGLVNFGVEVAVGL